MGITIKKLVIFLGIILSRQFVSAQNFDIDHVDSKIVEALGVDYVERMKEVSPQRLQYLTHFLYHSYFIMDFASGKPYPDISTVPMRDSQINQIPIDPNNMEMFNVLLYAFQRSENNRTFYKIGSTGKMIVFYSEQEFAKSYNEIYK